MEENKIPTVAEFYMHFKNNNEDYQAKSFQFAIEFAKMHVKKQQEITVSKVTANGNLRTDLIDFIPKCYPLENIK